MKSTNTILAIFFTALSELASDTAESLRLDAQEDIAATPKKVSKAKKPAAIKKDEGYDKARDILESEEDEPTEEPSVEPSEGNIPADVRQLGKRIQALIKAGLTNPSKIREALSHVGAATVANVEPESIALVWEFFAEEWAISQQGE
jgi:hypothetical protein